MLKYSARQFNGRILTTAFGNRGQNIKWTMLLIFSMNFFGEGGQKNVTLEIVVLKMNTCFRGFLS